MNNGVLFFLVLCIFGQVNAQPQAVSIDSTSTGVVLIRFDKRSKPKRVNESATILKDHLKLGFDDLMVAKDSFTDLEGMDHQAFYQFYKGVPVEFGKYGVHSKAGSIEAISGHFIRIRPSKDLQGYSERARGGTMINEVEALNRALSLLNIKIGAWQVSSIESWLRKSSKDSLASFFPHGELLICENPDGEHDMAYKFPIYSISPALYEAVYINAHNGELIKRTALSSSSNSVGTVSTKYSNTQTVTTDFNGATYVLKEVGNRASMMSTMNLGVDLI
jgi:Zn-dependent metalloprotease